MKNKLFFLLLVLPLIQKCSVYYDRTCFTGVNNVRDLDYQFTAVTGLSHFHIGGLLAKYGLENTVEGAIELIKHLQEARLKLLATFPKADILSLEEGSMLDIMHLQTKKVFYCQKIQEHLPSFQLDERMTITDLHEELIEALPNNKQARLKVAADSKSLSENDTMVSLIKHLHLLQITESTESSK